MDELLKLMSQVQQTYKASAVLQGLQDGTIALPPFVVRQNAEFPESPEEIEGFLADTTSVTLDLQQAISAWPPETQRAYRENLLAPLAGQQAQHLRQQLAEIVAKISQLYGINSR